MTNRILRFALRLLRFAWHLIVLVPTLLAIAFLLWMIIEFPTHAAFWLREIAYEVRGLWHATKEKT